jgi:hypothetical protein
VAERLVQPAADFRAEAQRQGRSGLRHEIGDALEAEHAQLCG